jgi:hypothetical protein
MLFHSNNGYANAPTYIAFLVVFSKSLYLGVFNFEDYTFYAEYIQSSNSVSMWCDFSKICCVIDLARFAINLAARSLREHLKRNLCLASVWQYCQLISPLQTYESSPPPLSQSWQTVFLSSWRIPLIMSDRLMAEMAKQSIAAAF